MPTTTPTVPSDILKSIKGWMGSLQPKARPVSAEEDFQAYTAQNKPANAYDAQATTLFNYKKEALAMAKEMAGDRKPTMNDYFIAAHQVGEKHQLNDKQWNAKIFADLSGQQIEGFQINKTDIQPSTQMMRYAAVKATQAAQQEGRKPTMNDSLAALQQIQKSGEKLPSIEQMEGMYDLDCDQMISNYYKGIDHHANFKGTVFANVNFHPAGTIMRDGDNGVALTEGASFNNVTFDGMGKDDILTLNKGTYKDIHFKDIRGGVIEVVDGTQIDGMDIRGMHAELHLGRASISGLDATGAHIVHLKATPGAQINQANFEGATIAMASELQGSVWKNVTFKESNLSHVDMRDTDLSNVHFTDASMKGLDLRGAKLNNVTLNGEPITSPEQLTALGVVLDSSTRLAVSPEMMQQYNQAISQQPTAPEQPAKDPLAQIRDTMQAALSSIGSRVEAPETFQAAGTLDIAPVHAIKQEAQKPGLSGITGGESVTLNDIAISTNVAQMDRTVPLEQQASGSNMSRDKA